MNQYKAFYAIIIMVLISSMSVAQSALANDPPPELDPIGEVIHIMGAVTAQLPDQEARKLELTSPVYEQDVITSGRTGNVEILFKDESVYSQGTDSSVSLDKFVYSDTPDSSTLLFNVGTGAMRYVTGKIVKQNPDAFALATPMATIGIRGTEVFATVSPDQEEIGVLTMDPTHSVTVTSERQSVTIPNAGLMTLVKPDRTMSPPSPIPAEVRESIIKEAPMTSQGEPGKYGNTKDLKQKSEGFKNLLNREKSEIGSLNIPPDYKMIRKISVQEKGLQNANNERDGKVDATTSLGGGNDTGDSESGSESEAGGGYPGGP